MELCSLPAIYLGPNYGGSNEDNGDLLQNVPCTHCYTQCPQPCSRLLLSHASTGDSWTLTGKSGSVTCRVTAPFSWVLVHKVLFVPSQSLFPQSCVSSSSSMVGLMVTSSKRAYAIPRSACHTQVCCTQSPCPRSSPLLTSMPQKTPKHSSVSVSVGSLGPGAHKVCLSPLSVSGRYGV